jgi:hypothetical protein
MTRKLPLGPIAGCVYFTLMGPLLAAQPANTEATNSTGAESDTAASKSADVCRNDLKAFNSQMEKDGYWYTAEGNGFGYPRAPVASECTANPASKGVLRSRGWATTMLGPAMRCASSSPPPTSSRGKDNSNPARTS